MERTPQTQLARPQFADDIAPIRQEVTNLLQRVDALCDENEMLGRELLRCYDQLNLVFEITENIANFDDPNTVEYAVLERWAGMLGASAAFVDDGNECITLTIPDLEKEPITLDSSVVQETLADEIRRTRDRRHTLLCDFSGAAEKLGGVQVILGALPRLGETPRVGIAIRRKDDVAFDSRDILASDSVLCYGGHVLSNILMVRRLQRTAFETVRALANAIDAKDRYTCGHSERVGFLARLLGEYLELSGTQLQLLEWGGILHDVGKIGIPERILNKRGRLSREEYDEIKRHSELSYAVLSPVASLQPILDAALYHHENYDGTGYPAGLAGDKIPPEARIVHVVDIFDALTSTRSYRRGYSIDQAFRILRNGAGTVTDPVITESFIRAMEQYMTEQKADFERRFPHIAENSKDATDDVFDNDPLSGGATCD